VGSREQGAWASNHMLNWSHLIAAERLGWDAIARKSNGAAVHTPHPVAKCDVRAGLVGYGTLRDAVRVTYILYLNI